LANLQSLFAGGTVTDDWYIDEILCRYLPDPRFRFRRLRVLPAPAKSERPQPKLYDVSFAGVIRPLFFCPVGPSATRPAMRERFLEQFRDNAALLRTVHCPDVQKVEPPARE